jgi:hypothetical protein
VGDKNMYEKNKSIFTKEAKCNHEIMSFEGFDKRYFRSIFDGIKRNLEDKVKAIELHDANWYNYEDFKIDLDVLLWARKRYEELTRDN